MEEDPQTDPAREGKAADAGKQAACEEQEHTVARTAVRETTRLPEDVRRKDGAPAGAPSGPREAPAAKTESPHEAAAPLKRLLKHRSLSTALAAVLIIIVIIVTSIIAEQSGSPAADQIQSDARALLSNPSYAGGMYGSDAPLDLQSIQIVEIRHTRGGPDPAAEVKVQAFLQNGSVDATISAQLDYEHRGDKWVLTGGPSQLAYAYQASAGVDLDKVRSSIDDVLAKAETSYRKEHGDDDGQLSLPTIYKDADITIASESFDRQAQSDVVDIKLITQDSFSRRSADVEATFRFMAASGLWELSEASVSDDAKAVDYAPLAGSWTGTFMSQNSSGAKCLAAKDHPLKIDILKVTSEKVEGTISCVAHFHEAPVQDQDSTDGDRELESVPFAGTRDKGQDASLSFTCTMQDLSGGTASLALSFGTDGSDSASASVTSSHVSDHSILFIPLEQTDTYTDVYELGRH